MKIIRILVPALIIMLTLSSCQIRNGNVASSNSNSLKSFGVTYMEFVNEFNTNVQDKKYEIRAKTDNSNVKSTAFQTGTVLTALCDSAGNITNISLSLGKNTESYEFKQVFLGTLKSVDKNALGEDTYSLNKELSNMFGEYADAGNSSATGVKIKTVSTNKFEYVFSVNNGRASVQICSV